MPSSPSSIYTGFWLNHLSPSNTLTLTLTSASTLALTSFLAILITHTSTRSFKIFRYTLHQLRAGNKPCARHHSRDSLSRHHDLLLANSETDMGALGVIIEIAWRWSSKRKLGWRRSWERSLPLLAVVLGHTVCWLAAGIASSMVADGGAAMVHAAKSQICGNWAVGMEESKRTLNAVREFQTQITAGLVAAQSYVRLCYGDQDRDRAECRVLRKRRIEWIGRHNTTCPWPGQCLEGDTAAFTLDTGLQSSDELGINSPSPLTWRHTLTCAPLITDGYLETRPKSGDLGEDVFHYNYGRVNSLDSNSSHWISAYTSAISTGLTLNVQTSTPWIGNSTLSLIPPPQFNRSDGDFTLLFFGAPGITFYTPIDDPIFSAHQKLPDFLMPSYSPLPVYRSDNPAGVLGCFEQLTFCNPRTGHCSPPSSAAIPANPMEDDLYCVAETKEEISIAVLLRIHLAKTSIYLSSITLGAATLRMNELLFANSVSGGVAREQWKVEVSHLFQLGLANAQLDIVKTGKGVREEDLGEKGELENLLPEEFRHICRMVVWPEPGYTNVSVQWLVVILVVSVVLTVISLGDGWVGRWVVKGERDRAWRRDQILGGGWEVERGERVNHGGVEKEGVEEEVEEVEKSDEEAPRSGVRRGVS